MRFLGYSLLSLFYFFSVFSPSEGRTSCVGLPQSIVTGSIHNQLGNQLFVVATTLAHAWDHGAHPCFPDFNSTSSTAIQYKFAMHRDRLFFRLDTSEPRPFTSYYHEPFIFCADPIPVQRDQRIAGIFHALNFFHHHRDRILALLAPADSELQYLHAKYGDLISLPNTVSVHVRTFNEAYHAAGLYFVGLEYLRKAMKLFPKDTVFVIFSDRINWCKVHFAKWKKKCVFIEGNDEIQDLFLMSMMKNHILSNSSYSWWGAYLDSRPGAIVVAPKPWMNPRIQPVPAQLYLPEWKTILPNLDEPYPTDIRDYDHQSLSTDTQ